jgi:hypothetical protein
MWSEKHTCKGWNLMLLKAIKPRSAWDGPLISAFQLIVIGFVNVLSITPAAWQACRPPGADLEIAAPPIPLASLSPPRYTRCPLGPVGGSGPLPTPLPSHGGRAVTRSLSTQRTRVQLRVSAIGRSVDSGQNKRLLNSRWKSLSGSLYQMQY